MRHSPTIWIMGVPRYSPFWHQVALFTVLALLRVTSSVAKISAQSANTYRHHNNQLLSGEGRNEGQHQKRSIASHTPPADKLKTINLAGIFPINGVEGWQGGQVSHDIIYVKSSTFSMRAPPTCSERQSIFASICPDVYSVLFISTFSSWIENIKGFLNVIGLNLFESSVSRNVWASSFKRSADAWVNCHLVARGNRQIEGRRQNKLNEQQMGSIFQKMCAG